MELSGVFRGDTGVRIKGIERGSEGDPRARTCVFFVVETPPHRSSIGGVHITTATGSTRIVIRIVRKKDKLAYSSTPNYSSLRSRSRSCELRWG